LVCGKYYERQRNVKTVVSAIPTGGVAVDAVLKELIAVRTRLSKRKPCFAAPTAA
jgi:hypothetical protein